MYKKILSFTLVAIMVISMSTTTFASDDIKNKDEVQVNGKFNKDDEYASMIKEKEDIAMQYYLAKVNQDSNTAIKSLNKLKNNSTSSPRMKSGSISPQAVKSAKLAIFQVPQEKSFWCGYAAMKSLLDYEGVEKTQTEIAGEVYSVEKDCPWYISNGDEKSQFPVAVKLTDWASVNYVPYPYGAAGGTVFTASDLKPKIIATIDLGHGLMALGKSCGDLPKHESILPGYPAREIGHWIAVYGYEDNGTSVWIIDPAKSKVISWSENINAYYSISSLKLAAFTKTRGIIW